MECPFNIPLKAKYGKLSNAWFIENAKGCVLFFDLTEQKAKYLVQAINCHEKYKTALEAILTMKPQLYAACFPSIIRTLEQALESEKK